MRNSPSCRCCFACLIIDQEDEGEDVVPTVVAGSWGFTMGIYSTSSASATRVTTVESETGKGWSVTCEIEFHMDGTGNQDGGIIGGYLDSGHYWFAGIRMIYDATAGMWAHQLVLGEVNTDVGPFPILHLTHPAVLNYNIPEPSGSTGETYILNLCWDGVDQITATVFDQLADTEVSEDSDSLSLNGVTPPGNKAGIATFLLDSGEIEFYGFEFYHSNITDPADAECGDCPIACCDGPSPDDLLLDISGGGSGYHVWPGPSTPTGDIRVQASELNGTHTIPYSREITITVGGSPTTTGAGHGGDGHCRWAKVIQLDAEYYNGTTWVACTIGLVVNIHKFLDNTQIIFIFARDSLPSDCYLSTVFIGNNFLDPIAIMRFDDNDPIPCEDWTDWQTADHFPLDDDPDFVDDFTIQYMAA